MKITNRTLVLSIHLITLLLIAFILSGCFAHWYYGSEATSNGESYYIAAMDTLIHATLPFSILIQAIGYLSIPATTGIGINTHTHCVETSSEILAFAAFILSSHVYFCVLISAITHAVRFGLRGSTRVQNPVGVVGNMVLAPKRSSIFIVAIFAFAVAVGMQSAIIYPERNYLAYTNVALMIVSPIFMLRYRNWFTYLGKYTVISLFLFIIINLGSAAGVSIIQPEVIQCAGEY